MDAKLKTSKALKQIMDANKEKYDGRDLVKYQLWKMALKEEVSYLETLDPTQWLELLKIRTKGDAREAVDRACQMQQESTPEQTLSMAWKFLDKRFQTSQKPS